MKDTSPTPTIFIQSPEVSIVAIDVLLLVYVIAPLLLLAGRVKIANDASPNVLDDETENVDDANVDVPREIRTLNVVLPALYVAVEACDALTITAEGVYSSIVATSPLMLIELLVEENVYAPSLLLAPIITVASENDASTPIVFDTC